MSLLEKIPKEILNIGREKWDVFLNACAGGNLTAPVDPMLVEAIIKVFGLSDFVAKKCIQYPDILIGLIESGNLQNDYTKGEYNRKIKKECEHASNIEDLSHVLRRVRSREICRIAIRDLTQWATLDETMKDLSDLADACLEASQSIIYQWLSSEYGTPVGPTGNPQYPVIIGLGKLGGNELNFSSDIDLMFAFPDAGQTDHPENPITNEQFFARLCQRVIEVIGKNLSDGFVFRVDARLRPFGESGPIVMSFDAMESYYQQQGREWERYALIKARIVAGDKAAGVKLLERLRPFVYRRYLDFGTFESLREMKQKISQEITRKGLRGNIKLGEGGIREIEFFGQIFQLIRGGVNPDYQQRGILKILQVLVDDNCIPQQVNHELSGAYEFLRNTENHIQMINDLQNHILPDNPLDQVRLAFSMGFKDWKNFSKTLNAHMGNVHRHFSELLGASEPGPGENDQLGIMNEIWQNLTDKDTCLQILKKFWSKEADEIYEVLCLFRDLTESGNVSIQGKKRIYLLVPHILQEVIPLKEPVKILKRIYKLVNTFRRRSCYASLLLENKDSLKHLVNLADASPWVMSFLSLHPLLLDELLDPRALYAPLGKAELKDELNQRLEKIKSTDLELQMDDLRIFKQINMLRISAADVAGLLPLMKVSDRLTYLAETIVDQVLEMSWSHLAERYGAPDGIGDGRKGFAIIAYGKLGGIELGYGSDLDLVFLHTGANGSTAGGKMSSLDNAQFYSRLGQRIIHFLTTMTPTGKLYDIDMRLRPSGSAGILVSHMEAFRDYQINKAWTWEHQALIKARPVSGDLRASELFLEIRKKILCIVRDKKKLKEEVGSMRERMRKEHDSSDSTAFDLRQGCGGVIDIEFIVQYLILLYAAQYPELIQWTDVVRQLNTLALTEIIDDKTAYVLKQAYLIFRYCIHRMTLEEKPAILPQDRFVDLREDVRRIWELHLV